MKKVFILIFLTILLITACGRKDTQVDGPTISGVVIETFTYKSENITIRGDFTEHNITSSDTIVLRISEARVIDKKGGELTLEDINEGDIVEVLLPESISTSDEDPLIIDTVLQLRLINN